MTMSIDCAGSGEERLHHLGRRGDSGASGTGAEGPEDKGSSQGTASQLALSFSHYTGVFGVWED